MKKLKANNFLVDLKKIGLFITSILFISCFCFSKENVIFVEKKKTNKIIRKDIREWINKLSLSDETKQALLEHALSEEKTLKTELNFDEVYNRIINNFIAARCFMKKCEWEKSQLGTERALEYCSNLSEEVISKTFDSQEKRKRKEKFKSHLSGRTISVPKFECDK